VEAEVCDWVHPAPSGHDAATRLALCLAAAGLAALDHHRASQGLAPPMVVVITGTMVQAAVAGCSARGLGERLALLLTWVAAVMVMAGMALSVAQSPASGSCQAVGFLAFLALFPAPHAAPPADLGAPLLPSPEWADLEGARSPRGEGGASQRGTPARATPAPVVEAHAEAPSKGWEYLDPTGEVQGPFGVEDMRLWYVAGFLDRALPVRCFSSDPFLPLDQLYPQGTEPFQERPRRSC